MGGWRPGNGKAFTGDSPFRLELARGNVPQAEGEHVHGYNGAVGTGFETLWAESTLKAYIDTAAAMTISSASANDTIAGSGAQKCLITYLDADWAVQTVEKDMNGQTGVAVATILRVLDIEVTQSGAGFRNADLIYVGTGTVTTGKPAVVHAAMAAGFNGLFGGCYSVPAGYTAYITSIGGSVGEGKTANIFLATRAFGEDTFVPHHHSLVFQQNFDEELTVPIELLEKSDIELQAFNDVASQAVSGNFDYVLIKNES